MHPGIISSRYLGSSLHLGCDAVGEFHTCFMILQGKWFEIPRSRRPSKGKFGVFEALRQG